MLELKLKLHVNTWLNPKKNFFNSTWLTHVDLKKFKVICVEVQTKKIFFFFKKKTKLT